MKNDKVTQKVQLPREVAEAIEKARELFDDAEIISAMDGWWSSEESSLEYLRDWNNEIDSTEREELVMSALVNGYEVEKSPEEKLREYYEGSVLNYDKFTAEVDREYFRGNRHGVTDTLNFLGITIEGINA